MIKFNKYFYVYFILLCFLGLQGKVFLSFIFVIIHEISHYCAARCFSYTGFDIELLPVGARINLKELEEASIKEDIIISLAGPTVNILLAAMFYYFKCEQLFLSNFALGAINLIPIAPLDGSRVVKDLLQKKFDYKKANIFSIYVSFFIGFLLELFCIFLYCRNMFNISIALFTLFTLTFSFKEKGRIAYIVMRDIVKKKYRFIKRGYINNRTISIHYKKSLLEALRLVDKGNYTIFIVLNEELTVIATIYEQEVLDALKKYGNICLEEYINSIRS